MGSLSKADISQLKHSNLFKYANHLTSPLDVGNHNSSHSRHCTIGEFRLIYSALILMMTVGALIKCVEGRMMYGSDLDVDWDCREYPCFCDNVFFRYCPDGQYCKERRLPRYNDLIPSDYVEPDHMNFEPDHLEVSSGFRPRSDLDLVSRVDEDMANQNGNVVKLRKVKVDDPSMKDDVSIYPVKVKIPVKIDDKLSVMPPVKPMYKMHEYTTEDTKLETEMVPVTETIIKPVGISKDQIVDSVPVE